MTRRLVPAFLGAMLSLGLGTVTPASAADQELRISHVEPDDAGSEVRVLLSLPSGAEPDLEGVSVTLDGTKADATAELAAQDAEAVKRTTILAIDTSNSMAENGRFVAAKAAAATFLETVPDDVEVGIVTFDGKVTTRLEPTTDHDAAVQVIDDLTLALGTLLNDGVIQAAKLAGTEGARSVLVLSDGADAGTTPLSTVQKTITDSGVEVDVVALDQSGAELGPLQAMSTAGRGDVIPSDPEALTAAFEAEAETLARQVLVTATIPETVKAEEASVQVAVPAGDELLTAQTFTVIRTAEAPVADAPRASVNEGTQIPRSAMYAGLAAIGLGLMMLLGGVMLATSSGRGPATVEDRIAAYTAAPGSQRGDAGVVNLDQAKDAAASMLRRNRGLEARIEARLEAAGSAVKPAEWLLLHITIVFLAGLVGALLSGASIGFIFLSLVVGAVVPWLWLGRKRKKRVKAFNSGLADTLQLMAGSLQAGMSLSQSIDTVVREGTEAIAGEFKRALIETRLGVSLEEAMNGIATRIGSQDFAWVVMAIKIQREVGGNLAELLTTVAATLRERDYLRRQVHTLSAEGRLSAYILGALPPGMGVYMFLVRRDYIMPLFTEMLGLIMLFMAAVLMGFGAFVMSRVVKVEV